jgi:hypothetical protein
VTAMVADGLMRMIWSAMKAIAILPPFGRVFPKAGHPSEASANPSTEPHICGISVAARFRCNTPLSRRWPNARNRHLGRQK